MNKFILASALAALVLPASSALAHPRGHGHGHGHGQRAHNGDYDRYGRYNQPRTLARNDRVWQDSNGRYRCRRNNGTTGLVIGAIGGALVGRTVDTRGDRTLGTLLGAAGGGLLGREIDRSGSRCR